MERERERERGREGEREREGGRERERCVVAATRIVKVNFDNYAFIMSFREETLVLG